MRKTEIAKRIHQEAGISEEEAATLLNWVFDLFKATLQKGEPITILGFGKFTVRSKLPRKGRNRDIVESGVRPEFEVKG